MAVSDGRGGTDSIPATITVTDVDEPGSVALSSTSPQVDTEITATLTDPDGSVTNETWQWEHSSDGTTNWSNVSGTTRSAYTVVDADSGKWLRAVVTYQDGFGSGKVAESAAVLVPPGVTIAPVGSVCFWCMVCLRLDRPYTKSKRNPAD